MVRRSPRLRQKHDFTSRESSDSRDSSSPRDSSSSRGSSSSSESSYRSTKPQMTKTQRHKAGQKLCDARHGYDASGRSRTIYDEKYEKALDGRRGCRTKCKPGERVKKDHSGCYKPKNKKKLESKRKCIRSKSKKPPRNVPHYPARDCVGSIRKGEDGKWYKSVLRKQHANSKKKTYHWVTTEDVALAMRSRALAKRFVEGVRKSRGKKW